MAGLLQPWLQSSLGSATHKMSTPRAFGEHMELSVIAALLAGSIGLSAAWAYVMLSLVLFRCNVRSGEPSSR
jgi:hypothetical protein